MGCGGGGAQRATPAAAATAASREVDTVVTTCCHPLASDQSQQGGLEKLPYSWPAAAVTAAAVTMAGTAAALAAIRRKSVDCVCAIDVMQVGEMSVQGRVCVIDGGYRCQQQQQQQQSRVHKVSPHRPAAAPAAAAADCHNLLKKQLHRAADMTQHCTLRVTAYTDASFKPEQPPSAADSNLLSH